MRALPIVFLLSTAVLWAQPSAPNRDAEQSARFFQNNDADGDGKLTLQEFPKETAGRSSGLTTIMTGSSPRKKTLPIESAARSNRRRAELPAGVRVLRDIVYARAPEQELKLDLYLPANRPEKPLPLIVWIHGGAWRAGSKDRNPAARFVAGGYVSASIAYRLSQTAVFPAQIHDCKAAIRWLRAHAGKYGIDPRRVAVWGSSAGGHLVALLGTSGGVEELEGNPRPPGAIQPGASRRRLLRPDDLYRNGRRRQHDGSR